MDTQNEKPLNFMKYVGYVALNVVDLAKSREFYTRNCNLTPSYEDDHVVLLRSQFEHHCVALYASNESQLRHISFETLKDEDTEALQQLVKKLGIPNREASLVPGRMGQAFQFQDIEGNWVEVYKTMSRLPSPITQGPFFVNKLGHFTLSAKNIKSMQQFYHQIGFRVSDSSERGVFMRCNPDHHGLAFLPGSKSTLHHHAYDIRSWEQVKNLMDWMYSQEMVPLAGPVRHGPGNNIAIYVRDPDGFIVEFYCELEQIWDDEDHFRDYPVQRFNVWLREGAPESFLS